MRNRKPVTKTKTKEVLRLEMFSDGVFAIATTLLILGLIEVLHSDHHPSLKGMLVDNWKALLAFLIGFFTILVCWINHHLVLSYTERADSKLLWINGFVLLIVTFTPFPTAVLAEYLGKESHNALAFFGFNYIMMSVAAYRISAYILKKFVRRSEKESLYYHTLLYKYSILYTVIAFFVCFFSVIAAAFFYIILFIVFAFPGEFSLLLRRRRKKGQG